MASPPRSLPEAHRSLSPSEQRAYLRLALGRIAWIVREKEKEASLCLEDPGSYLADAWNKLAKPEAEKFVFQSKEDIANFIVHEATYQVLMSARQHRGNNKRNVEFTDDHDIADETDSAALLHSSDIKFAAEKIIRHIEAQSVKSGKSTYAIKLIQLLRSDSASQFIRRTVGSRAGPAHFVLETTKIAQKLGISPNKVSKISRFITDQAHIVGGSSYYQFLEAIASADPKDETGTA